MRSWKSIAATLLLFSAAGANAAPESVADRAFHRRAVEAVLWGMPAVNFQLMLQAAQANGAQSNQLVYWSRPVNWRDQTLTPNPDTIYFTPSFDTRQGPVVLEIPPAEQGAVIVGSVDDAWQNALEDVGPAGADRGKGGKYLITPPGYTAKAPPGYIVLASSTFQGFALLRSNFRSRGDADIAAAVNYGKRVKVYPLSAGPAAALAVDVYDKPFDATIPYDWRFFEALHRFVQVEPWLTRDKVMIDLLKTLGIEKGKPFNPDARAKAMFETAAREAREEIDARYAALMVPPFNVGARWQVPAARDVIEGMQNGFSAADSYPFSDRAVIFSMAYFSAKHLGAGQFYLLSIADSEGQPLSGRKNYSLTVPANAPVSQYWSATLYDRETHALIRETSHSSRASNRPDLLKNPDGSVTLYFGPAAPPGKDANWVPTHGRDFEVMFRLYGPQNPLFEKTWKLPDVKAAAP